MKKELVNEKNRYLFYDDKNRVLAFLKQQTSRQKIIFPTDYIRYDFENKKFETFYNDFLKQYLWEYEHLLKIVSIDTIISHENGKLKKEYLKKISHYYNLNRVFNENEWLDIREKSAYQGLNVEMMSINMLTSYYKKKYYMSENDEKACVTLKRKPIKESE